MHDEPRARIEIFKSEKDGQFYNRLVAANNEPLMVSEGFPDKATAEDNIAAIESAFPNSVESAFGGRIAKVDLTDG